MQVDEDVVSAALFDLNLDELALLAEMEEEVEEINRTPSTPEPEIVADEGFLAYDECEPIVEAYIAQISDMTVGLSEKKELTDRMADSLAELDPNTENGVEGKAFIKKMYKLRGKKPISSQPFYPQTSEQCLSRVAGKVIQIEYLQEEMEKETSFNNFFADIYCAAYVNGLVTMKDGLS